MSGELVLVTGASGYIATHVVKILLQKGYRVRGTVRSLQNEAKVKPLHNLCPDAKYPLELVEADLTNDSLWAAALEGCDYVHHIASPFPSSNPEHEDELIKPAVNGTLSVLKACGSSVKRVVLTSSTVSINNMYEMRTAPWTEQDWTDPTKASGFYAKSKTLAEKAAWDYMKNQPSGQTFDLAVINPGFVMGPVLCGTAGTSMGIPKMLLERQVPKLANLGSAFCDVRDVAQAHVNAMTTPEASGQRHIVAPVSKTFPDVALILSEEFRAQGYNVPTSVMPSFMIRVLGLCNAEFRRMAPALGKFPAFDSSRLRNVLGIQPRQFKNTMLDMAYSMIEAGHIVKAANYSGPKYSEPSWP